MSGQPGTGAKIIAVVACVIAGAAIAVTLIARSADQGAEHHQQVVIMQQGRQLARMRSQLAGLNTTVAGLSQPSDPLAAYDQICNQQFTNSASGNDQTYYFPCTNNVQTIPEPGGG